MVCGLNRRWKLDSEADAASISLRSNGPISWSWAAARARYVACYAANQVLGTIWRGGKEDPDTKEIRDQATLRRLSDIGARDVIEAMLAGQMVATHEAAMECFPPGRPGRADLRRP